MDNYGMTIEDPLMDGESEEEEGVSIGEYDVSAIPNDFNMLSLFQFMKSGAIIIPSFQRNYVWDIKRASKLIESIVLGLPIPQIFLYEASRKPRSQFLVIDGQQRLMTIYYFMMGRFPKVEKRTELRQILFDDGAISDDVMDDDEYFVTFNLQLPSSEPGKRNRLSKKSYDMLPDKEGFEMQTVRNVVIKQNQPSGDSSIYEIFNRLNSGGVNLRPQEIRASMYHSEFYTMLFRLNTRSDWRNKFLSVPEPDLHFRDVEILLRSYAMLMNGNDYKPSMVRFLNNFSKSCKTEPHEKIQYLENLFAAFIKSCSILPDKAFHHPSTRKFGTLFFEAAFAASCDEAYHNNKLEVVPLSLDKVNRLMDDQEFKEASRTNTSSTANVKIRMERAKKIINGL